MLLQNYLKIIYFIGKFFWEMFNYMIAPFLGKFYAYTMFYSLEIFKTIDFLKFFLLMRIVSDVTSKKIKSLIR